MKEISAEWQSLADLLLDTSMMVGRSKLTGLAQMALATPILASMVHLGELLGRSDTKDSSLTRSQRKAGQALQVLASNVWVKLAEVHGAEKVDPGLIVIRSKKRLSGLRKSLDKADR